MAFLIDWLHPGLIHNDVATLHNLCIDIFHAITHSYSINNNTTTLPSSLSALTTSFHINQIMSARIYRFQPPTKSKTLTPTTHKIISIIFGNSSPNSQQLKDIITALCITNQHFLMVDCFPGAQKTNSRLFWHFFALIILARFSFPNGLWKQRQNRQFLGIMTLLP